MSYISEAKGYFVAYPSGSTTAAPGSVVALPGGVPGAIGVNPGLTYDTAMHMWVPVPHEWLTPSGAMYVYEDFNTYAINVVDVQSGALSHLVTQHGWYIVGTLDTGVYVADSFNPGVWYVPFAGPTPVPVTGGKGWTAYNDGALWLQSGSAIIRHDLTTGAERVVVNLTDDERGSERPLPLDQATRREADQFGVAQPHGAVRLSAIS
jgi:hypothetical protein